MDKNQDDSRREFIKKSAYAAPAILSLSALPAFAQNGSVIEDGPSSYEPGSSFDDD